MLIIVAFCFTLASASPRAAQQAVIDWPIPNFFGPADDPAADELEGQSVDDAPALASNLRGGRAVHKHKSKVQELPAEEAEESEEKAPPPSGTSANPEAAPAGTSGNPEEPEDDEVVPTSVALAGVLPEVVPEEQTIAVQSSAADLDLLSTPQQEAADAEIYKKVADAEISDVGAESSELLSDPIDGKSDAEVARVEENEAAEAAAEISAEEVEAGEAAVSVVDAALAATSVSARAAAEVEGANEEEQVVTPLEVAAGEPEALSVVEDTDSSSFEISQPPQVPNFSSSDSVSQAVADVTEPDVEDPKVPASSTFSESVSIGEKDTGDDPVDDTGYRVIAPNNLNTKNEEVTPETSEDVLAPSQYVELSVPSVDTESESSTAIVPSPISTGESEFLVDQAEISTGKSELLVDQATLLKEQEVLQKEKAGIEDVKEQLAEQIKSAQANQEAKEAQDAAWLQQEKEKLERAASQLQANASSVAAAKAEKLERQKSKLEEENGQLKERFERRTAKLAEENTRLKQKSNDLKETRDEVVEELRRTVEQNQQMRKLMEDIRDDQLRSAGESISSNASTSPAGPQATALDTATVSVQKDATVSPVLAVKHISQTGGSTIMSLLGEMTKQLPTLFPGHGEFFHYVDELNPVPRRADAPAEFVISSVRNPCDWYVSLWAFSSKYDRPALSVFGDASDPEPFFGDSQNASKFANWLQWSQGKWSESPTQSDCNSVMSLRYWEALKSGHHVGGMNERGYNGATLDKYSAWFDGKPRKRIEEDLQALDPSADVDCWVTRENMMDDMSACLKEYEKRSGVELDWKPFEERVAGGGGDPEEDRDECGHYYTPELAESVMRHDRHMFEAFGYNSCCGARTR